MVAANATCCLRGVFPLDDPVAATVSSHDRSAFGLRVEPQDLITGHQACLRVLLSLPTV